MVRSKMTVNDVLINSSFSFTNAAFWIEIQRIYLILTKQPCEILWIGSAASY